MRVARDDDGVTAIEIGVFEFAFVPVGRGRFVGGPNDGVIFDVPPETDSVLCPFLEGMPIYHFTEIRETDEGVFWEFTYGGDTYPPA